jgi:hypothetical protein
MQAYPGGVGSLSVWQRSDRQTFLRRVCRALDVPPPRFESGRWVQIIVAFALWWPRLAARAVLRPLAFSGGAVWTPGVMLRRSSGWMWVPGRLETPRRCCTRPFVGGGLGRLYGTSTAVSDVEATNRSPVRNHFPGGNPVRAPSALPNLSPTGKRSPPPFCQIPPYNGGL